MPASWVTEGDRYDFAGPQPAGKRGPKPKKGVEQPKLEERLIDPQTLWRRVTLPWYGGREKTLEMTSGLSLWHTPGQEPVPVHWTLVRCPEDAHFEEAAYLCSETGVSSEQVLAWFVSRWNIEVTFEEMRACLGFETQRQWSTPAIARTAPCLFGLFSLVVLMARLLHPQDKALPVAQTSWYAKEEATFGDALAAVRGHLWERWDRAKRREAWNYVGSPQKDEMCLIPRPLLERFQRIACYAN